MLRLLPERCARPARVATRTFVLLLFACLMAPLAIAKDVPITGVLVYGQAGSFSYAQISGFLVNGKTEMRVCPGTSGIDKSAYKGLAKLNLAALRWIERLPDGSLMAQVGEAPPICVVPGNIKFEKEAVLSPADLAEHSTYTGQVVGSSGGGLAQMPAFAPGVRIEFGSATDVELAEYLVARRAHTIAGWQGYLAKYSSASHMTEAKSDLLGLLIASGNDHLKAYQASSGTTSPLYPDLKQARILSDEANALEPGSEDAVKLRDATRVEEKAISEKASAELQNYRVAMAKHTRGYSLLVGAKLLSDQLVEIDPKYPPAAGLAAAVAAEVHSLDSLILTANKQIATQQYDDAYNSIAKFASFVDEDSRLMQIVTTNYKYHLDKGNTEAAAGDWKTAIVDLKKAVEVAATEESKNALAKAEAGLVDADNHAAADRATAVSQDRVDQKDVISAYEVLADLPEAQRALVKDQMAALQEQYLQSAIVKTKELQAAHTPIRGRADEDGIRQAYGYMLRASKISDDPEIPLKLELLADTISSYYVEMGKKYLGRPLASGVGLGWQYLAEASLFKPNMDAVRDAMTTSSAAYQMRARLSVGVEFLDQTSRRESAGFVDQMQQAFSTGLEGSGLPVRVVLPGGASTVPGTVEIGPNFQFKGDILQHHTTRSSKKVTLQSKYRSGSHELPSEAWNKADLEFEAANLDVQREQNALNSAQARKNKKQTEAASAALSAAQERMQQARARMNSLPKTTTEDVISSYNYTRTTLELTNAVELTLSLKDAGGNAMGAPIRVVRGEKPKTYTIVENIKPDDTAGLTEQDSPPDELQLMADVEVEARDALVKAARERVQELPQLILLQARSKSATNDADGAGEAYVLYLNCAPDDLTQERSEAVRYLRDHFDLHSAENLGASVK